MKYLITLQLIIFLCCQSNAQVDKYYVKIEGTHQDLVKFYKDKKLIASDNIRNGNGLNYCKKPYNLVYDRFDKKWYEPQLLSTCNVFYKPQKLHQLIAVRYGHLRDRVSVYAIMDDIVYRSTEWSDGKKGNTEMGVAVWGTGAAFEIRGFPLRYKHGTSGYVTNKSSFGTISFDPESKKFIYNVGNGAMLSSDSTRQERILEIEQ